MIKLFCGIVLCSFLICGNLGNLYAEKNEAFSKAQFPGTHHSGYKAELIQALWDMAQKANDNGENNVASSLVILAGTIEINDEERFAFICAEYYRRLILESENLTK